MNSTYNDRPVKWNLLKLCTSVVCLITGDFKKLLLHCTQSVSHHFNESIYGISEEAAPGHEIAPNTVANATKIIVLATKIQKLVAKLATRTLWVFISYLDVFCN